MAVSGALQPVMVAVDDDPEALRRIEAELTRRYGEDYVVYCECSADAAAAELEAMRQRGERVALVLADVWMAEQRGSDLLDRVRSLHPHAKRALLIDWGAWGDRPTAEAVLHAMATGRTDYYVLKPTRPAEEQFHRIISEFLHEWAREHSESSFELKIIADPGDSRAHELRDLLRRSGVPHGFEAPASPEDADAGPVVRMRDGTALVSPSNEDIVAAFGVETTPATDEFDLVIVGAGPAGLSAAVYATSEGLSTLVIERETIGGQAGSSSLIRNYLGFSRGVAGAELAQRAYQQAWVFGAEFAVSREVTSLELDRSPYGVGCDAGFVASAGAILLATGASYQRIEIAGVDALIGSGVYYGASTVEGLGLANEDAYVVGGGNSAGQAALHLSRSAARVRLLVRGPSLAADMSSYLRETIAATPNVEVLISTEVVDGGGDAYLEWLEIRYNATGETQRVEAAALFLLIGARANTSWLRDTIALDTGEYVLTGYDVLDSPDGRERWPLERPPSTYETSVPGVFAVGDTRSGAVKRVASAVGEGSVAIPDIHAWLATATTR